MSRRLPIRPSVRLRLTLLYTTLFVVTGAALLGVNYFLVSSREHRGGTAISIICNAKGGTGASGALLSPAAAGQAAAPPTCPNPQTEPGTATAVPGPSGGEVFYRGGQRVTVPASVSALKGLVSRSQAHTLRTLAIESGLALAGMAVVSLGLGWLVAGRVLAPVHRITNAARLLSQETLHERINLDGPDDELKELADTFDAMLARLDRAFSAQRRFAANASHELRTPLATERVLIDEALANRLATRDELRLILEQLRVNSEESEELIDALLVLARSEAGVERRAQVDLATVTAQVVERAGAEAVAAGVEIRTDLAPAPVAGDPALLERLVGNLVENAIRHNLPAKGWVEVRTRMGEKASLLHVVNSGRVLDPDVVPTLMEPFRRQGADRLHRDGGVGLGLSIVEAVVTAHRGRLRAIARPAGGLDLEVRLPLPAGARPWVEVGAPAAQAGRNRPADGRAGAQRGGRAAH